MLYVKVKGGDYYLIICRTDFYWARAMGFAGQQLDDGDGVSVGKQQHYCVNIYKSQFHSNQAQPLNQLLSTSTWMGGAGTTSLLVRVISTILLTSSPLCPLCRRGSWDRPQPPGRPAGPQRDDPRGLMDFDFFVCEADLLTIDRMLYLKCI